MPVVTLRIHQRPYEIACGPGEEQRLLKLAEQLDKRAREMAAAAGISQEAQLLLLTALTIMDDLEETRERTRELQAQCDRLTRERERAQAGVEEVAQQHIAELEDAVAGHLEHVGARIERIAKQLEMM